MPTGDRRGPALVLVAGVAAVLVALSGAPVVLAAVLVLAGAPAAFWAYVRLVPPGTIRLAPGMPAAVLVRGILTFAFFGADAYVSLTFQDVRDQPTWVAGVALTGTTLFWTAAAWVQERLVGRVGPRRLVMCGFALVAVGIAGMFGALGPFPIPLAVCVWSIAGFGIGLAYAPISVTVLGLVGAGSGGRLVRLGAAQRRARRLARHRLRRGLHRPRRVPRLADAQRAHPHLQATLVVAVLGIAAARRLPQHLPG